jgi:hypothetical protein
VLNTAEPAYSVKLNVTLPHSPIRLPRSCSHKNLVLVCDLPAPLKRNESVEWEIELEYKWQGVDEEIKITAAIEDPAYLRNITGEAKELVISITPVSNYSLNG